MKLRQWVNGFPRFEATTLLQNDEPSYQATKRYIPEKQNLYFVKCSDRFFNLRHWSESIGVIGVRWLTLWVHVVMGAMMLLPLGSVELRWPRDLVRLIQYSGSSDIDVCCLHYWTCSRYNYVLANAECFSISGTEALVANLILLNKTLIFALFFSRIFLSLHFFYHHRFVLSFRLFLRAQELFYSLTSRSNRS